MAGKVLIADSVGTQRTQISEALKRAGYQVVAEVADMGQALRKTRSLLCDLVVVDANLEGGKGLKTALIIDEDQLAAVLLLVNREALVNATKLPYLVKPVYDYTLIPAVETAMLYWRKYGQLKTEINRLEEKIETRKVVDRAKGLLVSRLQLNEPDAHRFLQKEAMNRGLTLIQVAREVIKRLEK
ncbi:MAG: ANTAR domain-containing response regulator [Methylocystaceae bacterium]